MREGVYINIGGRYERVSCFRHWTDTSFTDAHNKVAPQGRIYLVKCKDCGSSSFEDDGRYVNEFSCGCCVESYTEVYFYKD